MNPTSNQSRILAVSLSSRGFGYAVMEANHRIVDCGHKVFSKAKNIKSLTHIEKLIARNLPDALVLQAVNAKGSNRALRIKKLHGKVLTWAKKRKLKVAQVSKQEMQQIMLGEANGTKDEKAQLLAQHFPDELTARLPPARLLYKSEDSRMDIFDAVGLAFASYQR